ncbi:hypothetical protein ES708_18888 [subsurface metagenome]
MKVKEIDEKIINDFIKHSEIGMKNFIEWGYRVKEDFFLYRKIISLIGKHSENLDYLLKDDKFIVLTYLTLISWDMDKRLASIEFFDTYQKQIRGMTDKLVELKGYSLEKISISELPTIKAKLKMIYENLNLMISEGRIVSNSKLLHFLFPDLIMPIDNNTLNFLKQNDSVGGFLNIFNFIWKISNKMDLSKFFNKEKWNTTIPKVIDNIILSIVRERGKKENYNKRLNNFKRKIEDGKKNNLKKRFLEDKYKAIPKNILSKIIDEIREDGKIYFEKELIN